MWNEPVGELIGLLHQLDEWDKKAAENHSSGDVLEEIEDEA